MRTMERYLPDWLLFASDAQELVLAGAALLSLAVMALIMDRRRHRRDRVAALDRVGWMPWTALFFTCAMLGMGLVAAGLPGMMRG